MFAITQDGVMEEIKHHGARSFSEIEQRELGRDEGAEESEGDTGDVQHEASPWVVRSSGSTSM